MLADIASGHTTAADVLFLVAAFLATIAAAVVYLARAASKPFVWAPVAGWAAIACLAVAWLVL